MTSEYRISSKTVKHEFYLPFCDFRVVEDCASPDLAVIDDDEDMNLEELMKQKALLQARLGYLDSDTELDVSKKTSESNNLINKRGKVDNDVIFLDDSSGDKNLVSMAKDDRQTKRRRQKSPSPPRSPLYQSGSKASAQRYRSDSRDRRRPEEDNRGRHTEHNRNKEDLRRAINREKDRSAERRDGDRGRYRSPERGGGNRNMRNDRREYDGNRFGGNRRQYSPDRRMRDRSRSRNRFDSRRDYDDYRRKPKKDEDKFKDSLSEGLKAAKDSSSDSEVPDLDIDLDNEEDEETIIERRRKQRVELLKKFTVPNEDSNTIVTTASNSPGRTTNNNTDDDVVIVSRTSDSGKKVADRPFKSFNSKASLTPPLKRPEKLETKVDEPSLTPPIPIQSRHSVNVKPVVSNDEQSADEKKEEITGAKDKEKTGSKKQEWDMFAEQDDDTNFDVSLMMRVTVILFIYLYPMSVKLGPIPNFFSPVPFSTHST